MEVSEAMVTSSWTQHSGAFAQRLMHNQALAFRALSKEGEAMGLTANQTALEREWGRGGTGGAGVYQGGRNTWCLER